MVRYHRIKIERYYGNMVHYWIYLRTGNRVEKTNGLLLFEIMIFVDNDMKLWMLLQCCYSTGTGTMYHTVPVLVPYRSSTNNWWTILIELLALLLFSWKNIKLWNLVARIIEARKKERKSRKDEESINSWQCRNNIFEKWRVEEREMR